jgi:hypothetical protein
LLEVHYPQAEELKEAQFVQESEALQKQM